MTTLTRYNGKI